MIYLVSLKEMNKVNMFPIEVQQNVQYILNILDEAYYEDRAKNDDGGYVIVVESIEDFELIEKYTHINFENLIVEYVDIIECSNSRVYTSSLVLCNSDYGISLIIPIEITPKSILNQI